MGQSDQLYRLQQHDLLLQAQKKRLGEVLQAQQEPEPLRALRATAVALDNQLKPLRQESKATDLELGSLTQKISQAEERLYSGKVRSPKELADLQESVAAMKRQKMGVEEKLLLLMEEVEGLNDQATITAEELTLAEQNWVTKLARLQEEQMELALHINELLSQRQKTLTPITAVNLRDYEAIRKKKGGVAVALLKNGSCQGCQTSLPALLVRQIKEGHYQHCPSCGRILCN